MKKNQRSSSCPCLRAEALPLTLRFSGQVGRQVGDFVVPLLDSAHERDSESGTKLMFSTALLGTMTHVKQVFAFGQLQTVNMSKIHKKRTFGPTISGTELVITA